MPTKVGRRVYRRLAPSAMRGRYLPSRFARKRRATFQPAPRFTETCIINQGLVHSGGVPYLSQLNCALNSIPQWTQYSALYNQARILRVQYLLVPNFTQYEQQGSVLSSTMSVTAPRLVYAIQDTANAQPPVSELDVLTDNGCKIKLFNKPIRIGCRPVPCLQQTSTLGGVASVSKRYQWLTTDATGSAVPHLGVNYAIVQDQVNTASAQIQWNVYAKITFQLRDPK